MCTHRERYVRGFLMSLFPILLYGNKNKLSPCDAGRPHWKQEQDVVFLYHYLEVLCCLRKFIEAKCKRWAVWSKMQRLRVRAEWEQPRRQPGHHKSSEPSFLWAGGSRSSDTPSIGAGKGRSTGRDDFALHLAAYLDITHAYGAISTWSTWKICVFSPWEPIPNSKIQGQGTMKILEYHLFHHVCMTDRSSMSRVVQKSSRLNIWLLAASGLGRCLQTP